MGGDIFASHRMWMKSAYLGIVSAAQCQLSFKDGRDLDLESGLIIKLPSRITNRSLTCFTKCWAVVMSDSDVNIKKPSSQHPFNQLSTQLIIANLGC